MVAPADATLEATEPTPRQLQARVLLKRLREPSAALRSTHRAAITLDSSRPTDAAVGGRSPLRDLAQGLAVVLPGAGVAPRSRESGPLLSMPAPGSERQRDSASLFSAAAGEVGRDSAVLDAGAGGGVRLKTCEDDGNFSEETLNHALLGIEWRVPVSASTCLTGVVSASRYLDESFVSSLGDTEFAWLGIGVSITF